MGGPFNAPEHLRQRFIEVLVGRCLLFDVLKKLARQDKEAPGLDQIRAGLFGNTISQLSIVKDGVAGIVLAAVNIICQVFRYVAVKQHPEDILLKIPAVHAATKVVGDIPYRAV
ncbi:MAG: hypothetical protein DDT34_02341 [Firmicutes bacterium]|nr:hypothetical protein [Bacillota bacterium]